MHSVMHDGLRICLVQQAVAHCCGVTFIGMFNAAKMQHKSIVEEMIAFYKQCYADRKTPYSLFYVKNLNFYLSEETAHWDKHLKAAGTLVTSFKNGGHTVEHYVIVIHDDATIVEETEEDQDD